MLKKNLFVLLLVSLLSTFSLVGVAHSGMHAGELEGGVQFHDSSHNPPVDRVHDPDNAPGSDKAIKSMGAGGTD